MSLLQSPTFFLSLSLLPSPLSPRCRGSLWWCRWAVVSSSPRRASPLWSWGGREGRGRPSCRCPCLELRGSNRWLNCCTTVHYTYLKHSKYVSLTRYYWTRYDKADWLIKIVLLSAVDPAGAARSDPAPGGTDSTGTGSARPDPAVHHSAAPNCCDRRTEPGIDTNTLFIQYFGL